MRDIKKWVYVLGSILTILLCISPSVVGNSVKTNLGTARLDASVISLPASQKSQRIMLLLELSFPKKWHSYWINPGESGYALSLDWSQTPDIGKGIKVGDAIYQTPSRYRLGELVNYGFESPMYVMIPVTISAQKSTLIQAYRQEMIVDAKWLVCDTQCVPDSAQLKVSFQIDPTLKDAVLSEKASLMDSVRAKIPSLFPSELSLLTTIPGLKKEIPEKVFMDITDLATNDLKSAYFYPENSEKLLVTDQQQLIKTKVLGEMSSGSQSLTHRVYLEIKSEKEADFKSEAGILVLETTETTKSYQVNAIPEKKQRLVDIVKLIAFAFFGGLLLNIMPCVFPVLSLKAMSVLKTVEASTDKDARSALLKDGVGYTAGVLASFWGLALVLVGLRAGGAELGWGFHLQSPLFVSLLIVLFVWIGAYCLQWVQVPKVAYVVSGRLAQTTHSFQQSTRPNSFWTGVIATVVATPCTAPLMAPAIGIALTQSIDVILLIFSALGLGLASPFLALGLIPGISRLIPKPGTWMIRMSKLLSLPLFLTGVWLLWVLHFQVNWKGVLLTILVAGVVLGISRLETNKKIPGLLSIIILALVLGSLSQMTHFQKPDLLEKDRLSVMSGYHLISPIKFSDSRLKDLREKGVPVFVDATAAWCISCQFNKKTTLQTKEIQALFKKKGIQLMIADWTTKDPNITRFLAQFNRIGVPLYIYYPENAEPIVFEETILTPALLKSRL